MTYVTIMKLISYAHRNIKDNKGTSNKKSKSGPLVPTKNRKLLIAFFWIIENILISSYLLFFFVCFFFTLLSKEKKRY